MKLFNKKEEKSKVGRPRLADFETKKKAVISISIALVMVVVLLLTGAFKLNVINLNKLKGTVNVNLCNEIPAKYQPRSESNPEGIYEYGFTDPKFYSAVVSTYNKDVSYCSTISEEQLANISRVNISMYSGNLDVNGLQYLTNLSDLSLSSYDHIKPENLDLSYNKELKKLNLNNTRLNEINLRENKKLIDIYLEGNNLENIDLENIENLESLNLSSNKLTNINVEKFKNLKSINVSFNNLASIDLTNNTNLESLYIYNNSLTNIDLTNNTNLESLYMDNNSLTDISLPNSLFLKVVSLNNNDLTNIDLTNNTNLEKLYIDNNNIENLDLSNNHLVSELFITNNPNLNAVNLSENSKLAKINEGYGRRNIIISPAKKLDLSNIKELTYVNLSGLKIDSIDLSGDELLTSIDLSNNPNLIKLDLSSNPLVSTLKLQNDTSLIELDLSNNPLISKLDLQNNSALKLLNLSGNEKLTSFYADDFAKNLEDLNLSDMKALTIVKIEGSNLINLDLSNSPIVSQIYINDSPNLKSINLSGNEKINGVENCWRYQGGCASFANGKLRVNSEKIEKLNLSDMKILETVDLAYNGLKDINLNGVITLTALNLGHNNLSNLTLDDNPNLTNINVDYNKLNNIDLSKISDKLISLNLSNNKIEKINLKNFINLTSLYLNNNNLIELDLSNNNLITNLNLTNNNNLKKLNLSGIDKLQYFNLSSKGIEELNASNMESMKSLTVTNGKLKKINLSNTPNLETINLENNNLVDIDLKDKSKLVKINLNYNDLEDIDLNKNTLLTELKLSNNKIKQLDLSKNTLLTDLEILNNKLENLDLSKNKDLNFVVLNNNDLNNILLPKSNLISLYLNNNKLKGKLDLSKYKELEEVYLDNNDINEIVLGENENLGMLSFVDNNIKSLDLSGTPNLYGFMPQENPISDTIYMLKGSKLNYNNIKLNENLEINYQLEENGVVTYENKELIAKKEGISQLNLSTENILSLEKEYYYKCMFNYEDNEEYCNSLNEEDVILPYFLSNEIKVYDILSDVYEIDKNNKTINVSGMNLEIDKIKLTLKGLKAVVSDDNYMIKDNEKIVDVYKILNSNPSNEADNVKGKNIALDKNTTNGNKKSSDRKTSENKVEDIKLSGSFVSVLALQTIKETDRNIILENDNITLTINGKDIDKIEGNLDLNYELKELGKSFIYNEVKDKVNDGLVLSFKSNSNLPGKVLVELETTELVRENLEKNHIMVYNYDNDKYSLIARDLSSYNNKISFYINKLGNYVLTNNEINKKNIDIDSSMYKENTKLSKDISNKKIIIPLTIFMLLIILGIIGYVVYKKNKEK